MRRKGTPIGQYGSDLDFGVPRGLYGTSGAMGRGVAESRGSRGGT
jgi:hypothetical protein